MSIVAVGISHRGAPLAVRERIAYRTSELLDAIAELRARAGVTEGVVLSTCNRTEFYLASGDDDPADDVWSMLARRLDGDASGYGYVHRDRDAVAHLFRVAAGLDSMILGEAQIHGQVKAAWESCRAQSGAVLNRLFQSALLVGGRVRSETSVGRGAASVSSAALQLSKQIFGSLAGRRAMVLGAGEMAELALDVLANEGVRAAVVANRTFDRAQALAERFGAQAIGYDECWEALGDIDLLLCSTAAPVPVVSVARVRAGVAGRRNRPLCILDIALPRDVEPAVGELDNVFLYNLDDLQAVVSANLERRRAELPSAEQVIEAETARYWEWLAGLAVVPTLTSFRGAMDRLRERELAEAVRRMPDLSPAQRAQVEAFSRALMNKFVHEPTVRVRAAATNGRGLGAVDTLRYLFALEGTSNDAAASASAAEPPSSPPLTNAPLDARAAAQGDD